jgi:hypothetical protein
VVRPLAAKKVHGFKRGNNFHLFCPLFFTLVFATFCSKKAPIFCIDLDVDDKHAF